MSKTRLSTLASVLAWARDLFQNSQALLDHSSHGLDAEILLSFCIRKPRTYLRCWPDREVSADSKKQFEQLALRRAQGEPIAYLTARREFWDMTLQVTPATLIPRQDTEVLVEAALELIPQGQAWHIADLGTGSGAIALVLAKHRPRSHLVAVDNSREALALAEANAKQQAITNISFLCSHWFDQLPLATFDLIASNPPYIAVDDPHLQRGDVRFEPKQALVSGKTGLDDLQHLIRHAADYLNPSGYLMLEHGYDQADAVRALFEQSNWINIVTFQDLSGHDRCTTAQRAR